MLEKIERLLEAGYTLDQIKAEGPMEAWLLSVVKRHSDYEQLLAELGVAASKTIGGQDLRKAANELTELLSRGVELDTLTPETDAEALVITAVRLLEALPHRKVKHYS